MRVCSPLTLRQRTKSTIGERSYIATRAARFYFRVKQISGPFVPRDVCREGMDARLSPYIAIMRTTTYRYYYYY